MKKIILVVLIWCTNLVCYAQTNNIDTLLQKIKIEKDDSTKIALYHQLAFKYIFNDKEKAIETLNAAEKIAKKKGQEYGYNSFLNVKAIYYDINGMADSAKYFFEKSLQYSRSNKFKVHEEHTLNNLGMYAWNKGDYDAALTYYFASLKLAEAERGDDTYKRKDASYNNIGLVYQDMELYQKAIPYHFKALKIRIENDNNLGQASSYNNLGICYNALMNYDSAQYFFEQGIKAAKTTKDVIGYYKNTQGLADIFAQKNNYQEALKLYMESYNRPGNEPINHQDKVHITSGIAGINLRLKNYQQAIKYGEICVAEMNSDTTTNYKQTDVFEILATAYYAIGDVEKGALYNRKFYMATTKKFTASAAASLQELETKYETQKKELALQKSTAALRKKNTIIYSALGLAILLGLIGYLVYKQQRIKNEQLVKENNLKQALTKIENQNNLQTQRLEISNDLHDNIGSQLTFIISSLDNLKYFEFEKDPLYAKVDMIGGFTKNTITDLRDTIWAMNKEKITFEDLKTRTTNFIEAAKASLRGIDFIFNYPTDSTEVVLSSKLGIDVYRIIQEAVNNAIKHASATKVVVNFEQTNDGIEVSISDNGVGFDTSKTIPGNGLLSMKKRAEIIPAKLEVVQLSPGTKVVLTFREV